MTLFRKKIIVSPDSQPTCLHRCLTAYDLTFLGIGAIIGAGVFVLTGVAAATKAGPAISISYMMAGLAAVFAALAYAELAASIGGCGSAYNYAYVGFGELIAWIIGWDLLLEYAMSVSTVAIGWSGYVHNMMEVLGIGLPEYLLKGPMEGGIVNLVAVLIILVLATLLSVGVKHSARFNEVIVFIKFIAITVFVIVAANHVNFSNWHDFLPFGWTGVIEGAALVFFAYIGFDAVSTAAEETIHPQRDVPIGILASLGICTAIYILIAALLTLIVPYTTLNVKSPVAESLLQLGHSFAAGIVAAGAIAGLTTVMLVMYFGLTRVFLAISRDGLLPSFFAKVHPQTKTPLLIIWSSGVVIALIAGFLPIAQAAELVNIGTLAAFALACAGVIVLRYTQPNLPRPFKLPFSPLFPLLGIGCCIYLMLHLSWISWERFIVWMATGMLIYFLYSRKHSV